MNTPLLDQLRNLLAAAALAVDDPRPRRKFAPLALALLCADKPKTITSALEWLDQRDQDWSADYRLFSQAQWDVQTPFLPVFTQALAHPACGTQRVYLGTDDTLVRKSSKKTFGSRYARDPLSPPFQVNLVLGQRFVQTSLLPSPGARTIPGAPSRSVLPTRPPPKFPNAPARRNKRPSKKYARSIA